MYQLPLAVVEVDYVNELFLKHHLFEQHDVNQISVIQIVVAAVVVAVAVVELVDVEVIGLFSMDVDREHNVHDVEE
jgi:hypothetical protein